MILTFGELLLRLASPGYTRLLQKDCFDATFCGAEANVAVSLANYGMSTRFLTVLPDNEIGYAAANSLRWFGVDTSTILYRPGRMGLFYLEKGASQRPSKVIYDRAYSSIALSNADDYDWDSLFDGMEWFHFTGITPALSDELAIICLNACKKAKELGITISCDLNYRAKLWSTEKAQSVMSSLMQYVNVCFANEEDAEKVLGIKAKNSDIENGTLNREGYKVVAEQICQKFGCTHTAISLRKSFSASRNGWSGMLYESKTGSAYYSRDYEIQIIDRVGSGDSFTAGVIYGLINHKLNQDTIEFATAASCLKHSIEGDFNRVTAEEVDRLIRSSGNGRVVR